MADRKRIMVEAAWAILHYLRSHRGVGHTFAMLNGAEKTKRAMVLVDSTQDLPSIEVGRRVPLWAVPKHLSGCPSAPLLVDNFALSELLDGLLGMMTDLDRERAYFKLRYLQERQRSSDFEQQLVQKSQPVVLVASATGKNKKKKKKRGKKDRPRRKAS